MSIAPRWCPYPCRLPISQLGSELNSIITSKNVMQSAVCECSYRHHHASEQAPRPSKRRITVARRTAISSSGTDGICTNQRLAGKQWAERLHGPAGIKRRLRYNFDGKELFTSLLAGIRRWGYNGNPHQTPADDATGAVSTGLMRQQRRVVWKWGSLQACPQNTVPLTQHFGHRWAVSGPGQIYFEHYITIIMPTILTGNKRV